MAEIEEAIKLQPDRSASYTNLGVIEVTRGKREAAEKAFKKAIELDGRSAPAHLALANFLWATGRQAEAAPHLAQALAAEPENPLVLRAMVNFAVAQNRLDEAERLLKRIAEITKSPDATIALADFYIARRDEATARNVLGPLESSPQGSAAATIRLAALDHAAGRRDEALARLEKVLASDADEPSGAARQEHAAPVRPQARRSAGAGRASHQGAPGVGGGLLHARSGADGAQSDGRGHRRLPGNASPQPARDRRTGRALAPAPGEGQCL